MTDSKKRTLELDDNTVAIEAHGALRKAAIMLSSAPEAVRPVIEAEMSALLEKIVPRIASLYMAGPALPISESSIVEMYTNASTEARRRMPKEMEKALTPALHKFGMDLSALVDEAIASFMKTAENEDWVSHDAFLDIVEGHAIIMRGVKEIASVPADFTMSDEEKEQRFGPEPTRN